MGEKEVVRMKESLSVFNSHYVLQVIEESN